jgi:S-adenosylmethionine synthetase
LLDRRSLLPFELSGPEGDNGLSGKTPVVDGVRAMCADRGRGVVWEGLLQGRSGRRAASRRLAKLAVRLGLASEVRVTLGYFLGDRGSPKW